MIATGFSKQKKGFNTAKSQLASLRQKLQGKGPRCPTAGCDTRVVREDILIHIRTLEPLFLEGSNSHCWSTSLDPRPLVGPRHLQLECRTTLKCLYRSSANQMPCQKKTRSCPKTYLAMTEMRGSSKPGTERHQILPSKKNLLNKSPRLPWHLFLDANIPSPPHRTPGSGCGICSNICKHWRQRRARAKALRLVLKLTMSGGNGHDCNKCRHQRLRIRIRMAG